MPNEVTRETSVIEAITRANAESAQPPVETTETAEVTTTTEEVETVEVGNTETETTETAEVTTTTEEVETVAIDYDKLVQEKFGYDSLTDLLNSNAVDKVKLFDEIKAEQVRVSLENEELMAEFETVNSPFANDSVHKLNALMKANPELGLAVASKLLTTDLNSLSDLDKIVLAEQLNNPDLNDRLIKRSLIKKFGVESFDELLSADLEQDTKDDITIASKQANKVLAKYNVNDLETDKFIPEKVKEKINQRIESRKVDVNEIERIWSPAISDFQAGLKEIPIPTLLKDGKVDNSYTKMVLSDAERKQYSDLAMMIAKQNGLKEVTKESQDKISEAVHGAYILNNLHRIIKVAVDKAAQDEYQRIKAERDGVLPANHKVEVPGKGNQQRTAIDAIAEHIENTNKRS